MSQPGNTREVNKLAGLCTYSTGCRRPVTDSGLCARHQKSEPKRQRASMRAIRAARRANNECAECGAKDAQTKAGNYRCETCATKLTAARASVTESVTAYDDKLDRIRARTVLEGDGRTRYRGQLRRGRQSVIDLDRQDRELCRTYLAKYEAAIDYARRPEAADVPRIQRDEAVRAANDYLRLAGRFANDILVRNGEPPIVAVPDDDDDDDEGDEA